MHKSTLYDVAEIAGVSHTAVSMALKDSPKISEKTKLLVRSVAKELDFMPNDIARALTVKRTNSIGILTYYLSHPFNDVGLNGIKVVLQKYGLDPVIYWASARGEDELVSIKKILAKQVDGLIVFQGSYSEKEIEYLKKHGTPFVFFGKQVRDSDVSFVVDDNEKGTYKLTKHCIGLGHKRIAFAGYKYTEVNKEKLSGYKRAFEESGLAVNEDLILLGGDLDVEADLKEVVDGILALNERPTAVVVFSDEVAVKLINILDEKGIRVPEDMAVVGADNIPIAGLYRPQLTTVNNFPYEMGMKAAEILVNRINSGPGYKAQQVVFEPELVVRKSCGAYLKRQ